MTNHGLSHIYRTISIRQRCAYVRIGAVLYVFPYFDETLSNANVTRRSHNKIATTLPKNIYPHGQPFPLRLDYIPHFNWFESLTLLVPSLEYSFFSRSAERPSHKYTGILWAFPLETGLLLNEMCQISSAICKAKM